MPSTCCIKQCGLRKNKKHPTLTMHRFPANENLQRKWTEIIGTENINQRPTIKYVCSMHFSESSFNRTLDVIRLRDGAVPSSSLLIENDMENHIKCIPVGGIIKLKKGTLPHKYKCQEETNDEPQRSAVRNRKQLVTEMEIPPDVLETDSYRNEHCCGCSKRGDEIVLKHFNIQCEPLKDLLKVDSILLCYVCKRIARKAEHFIQNVQNNQILLQNYETDIPESKKCLPTTTLTQISLPPVELPEPDEEESSTVMSGEVKMEQMEDANEDYEEIFIKEEDTSHILQPKEEVTSEEDSCSQISPEIEREGKRKVMETIIPRQRKIMLVVKTSMSASTDAYETEYTLERVTEKQCMEEREQRSQDSRYLSCIYRCGDCIKGFMHRTSFDMHMKLHSSIKGDFICEICRQRFESPMKMAAHKKCHIYRYKCTKCDVNRISQSAIRSHYADKHSSFGSPLHRCTICPKVFKNKVSLRKHEDTHSRHERVTCDDCQVTFISKDTLRNHILRKHSPEGFSDNDRKRHVCQHCGMAFMAPYLLKNHAAMHTESRPYYCVECDRSFKTDKILTRHLKTASRHVFNADLHVSCDQCEKRFTCRRDLERHVNSAHLNLRPYACDKCDRAYLNSWSLREHKMYSHEGYRKERRYPCTLCDKVFDRSSILKSHIRTHTGERPYRCNHCPSQFVQSSQLRTHTNLVHLKLTRDGKPKSTALK